jgi:YesN/AraC family two-component response regulator
LFFRLDSNKIKGLILERTIVLIDDEEAALRTMELALSVAGYHGIEMHTSWYAAVRGMDPARTALLLIDIIMPAVTGIDALVESRKRFPSIPVVMVTAVNDVDSAVACMKLGAADYLIKPLKNDRFLNCIRSVLLVDELQKQSGDEDEDRECDDENVLCVPDLIPAASTERLSRLEHYLNCFIDVDISKIPVESRSMFYAFADLMHDQKVFLDPDISLDGVAERMHTNITYLRTFIKTVFKANFRLYVNALRIREFLTLAYRADSSLLSIEGLCASVGFSRKATFYSAFKTITGSTPGYWLSALENIQQSCV